MIVKSQYMLPQSIPKIEGYSINHIHTPPQKSINCVLEVILNLVGLRVKFNDVYVKHLQLGI